MLAITLSQLGVGQRGVIGNIDLDSEYEKRLNNMGFLPNEEIICICRCVFGSPILYQVKGAAVALRRSDADKIFLIDR